MLCTKRVAPLLFTGGIHRAKQRPARRQLPGLLPYAHMHEVGARAPPPHGFVVIIVFAT